MDIASTVTSQTISNVNKYSPVNPNNNLWSPDATNEWDTLNTKVQDPNDWQDNGWNDDGAWSADQAKSENTKLELVDPPVTKNSPQAVAQNPKPRGDDWEDF